MDVPPSIEESECALANLHRHIFETCQKEQDLDPESLKKMVIDMAKNDPAFGKNPKQAVLSAISDVTCQHLYTRGRSPSTENDTKEPQQDMVVDEENSKSK
eukprot:4710354-Karenia_brevis.AAC.1